MLSLLVFVFVLKKVDQKKFKDLMGLSNIYQVPGVQADDTQPLHQSLPSSSSNNNLMLNSILFPMLH